LGGVSWCSVVFHIVPRRFALFLFCPLAPCDIAEQALPRVNESSLLLVAPHLRQARQEHRDSLVGADPMRVVGQASRLSLNDGQDARPTNNPLCRRLGDCFVPHPARLAMTPFPTGTSWLRLLRVSTRHLIHIWHTLCYPRAALFNRGG
jgi:hypothetical protein